MDGISDGGDHDWRVYAETVLLPGIKALEEEVRRTDALQLYDLLVVGAAMKHKPVEGHEWPNVPLVCLADSYDADLTPYDQPALWRDCTWHVEHGLVKPSRGPQDDSPAEGHIVCYCVARTWRGSCSCPCHSQGSELSRATTRQETLRADIADSLDDCPTVAIPTRLLALLVGVDSCRHAADYVCSDCNRAVSDIALSYLESAEPQALHVPVAVAFAPHFDGSVELEWRRDVREFTAELRPHAGTMFLYIDNTENDELAEIELALDFPLLGRFIETGDWR